MPLILRPSPELTLSLDPVGWDERLPSIAFDMLVEVAIPHQQARIMSRELWFTHEALQQFECQLADLRTATRGLAALLDLSDRHVLQVEREGHESCITMRAMNPMQTTTTVVQVRGCASAVSLLYEQMNAYDKWW